MGQVLNPYGTLVTAVGVFKDVIHFQVDGGHATYHGDYRYAHENHNVLKDFNLLNSVFLQTFSLEHQFDFQHIHYEHVQAHGDHIR